MSPTDEKMEVPEIQKDDPHAIFKRQKDFFDSGATLSTDFREKHLGKLHAAIRKYENEIYEEIF